MNTERVKEIFQKFVDNERTENSNNILVLNGDWGVGKTYLWEDIINKNSKNKLNNRNYMYISLFGINSISDFKKQLIINKGKIAKARISLTYLIDMVQGNVEGIPIIGKNIKLANLSGLLFDSIYNNITQDGIICIDDIERRGKNLNIIDLLGTILQLKEKNNCKIIFILNINKLSKQDKDEFDEYYEKLIDFSLNLSPDTKYAVDCAIKDNFLYKEKILYYCNLMNINNIRIIKKMYILIQEIIEILPVNDDEIIEIIIKKIILLIASLHFKKSNIPTVEFLKKYDLMVFSVSRYLGNNESIKNAEDEWVDTLLNYGYNGWDKYDEYLSKYIETSWLDPQFNEYIESDELIKLKEFSRRIYKEQIVSMYRNSFNDNEEDFIEKLMSYYNNHDINIDISILNGIVNILRSLGKDEDANRIINHHFETNENILFDIKNNYQIDKFHSHYIDPMIRDKITAMELTIKESLDLRTIIHKMVYQEYMDDYEYNLSILRSTSIDDFYQLFKSEDSEHLHIYIESLKKIPNVTEALKRIARENMFNKVRIANLYGIKVDE